MTRVRPAAPSLASTAPYLAVAGLGSLVLHQMVYVLLAMAGRARLTGDHGHLSAQWAVLTPAAVIGAAVLVLRQVRTLGYQPPSIHKLAMGCASLFVIQEVVEASLTGSSAASFLLSPAALLGALVAPLVGWAIHRTLAGVAEVVARFVRPPTAAAPALAVLGRPADLIATVLVALAVSPSRGPPFMFA